MSRDSTDLHEREERLSELLVAYLEAADRGQSADRQALLDAHPEFAAELARFLAGQDRMEHWVAPLRGGAQRTPGTVAAAEPDGTRLGDYELREEIGRGGMGVVHKAWQRSLQRLVAVKTVRLGELASAAEARRFHNEAEMVAALDHPHIVPIYDVGEEQGQLFFSMKLLEGGSLAEQLPRFRTDPRAAAALLVGVARAVHHAHQRGILHRDLKPANVLLDGAGRPYVTDFGLAKRVAGDSGLTQSGEIIGTPSYMAPEQTCGRGAASTVASDVYGLGAILYALLTAQPPFQGATVLDTLAQLREREPPRPAACNPQVDRDLEAVCLKCLEKDPARRYPSAQALAEDLERWLAGETIQARPVTRADRLRRWARRKPALAALAVCAAVLVVLLATGLPLLLLVRGERNRALANLARAERAEAELRDEQKRTAAAAHLARARAWRGSGRVGQRYRSLEEVAAAARLSPSPEVRNEAITCLTLPDLRLVRSWEGCPPDTLALAVDGRAEHYACSDGHGNLTVRRIADDQEVRPLPGWGDPAWLVFSPDGRYLAAMYDREFQFRIWDLRTSAAVLATRTRGHVDFSPGGRWVAVDDQSDDSVRVYETASGKEVQRLTVGPGEHALAFHPDGRQLAVASLQGPVIGFYDVLSGQAPQTLRPPAPAKSLAWGAYGRFLAVASVDSNLYVWDAGSMRLQSVLRGPRVAAYRCGFLCGDDLFFSVGWESMVRFWDPLTGKELLTKENTSNLRFFTTHGGLLGFVDGSRVELWEATSGGPVARAYPGAPGGGPVSFADLSPDGRWLAVTDGSGIRLWDARARRLLASSDEAKGQAVLFHPTENALLAYGNRGLYRRPVVAEPPPGGQVRLGPAQQLGDWAHRTGDWAAVGIPSFDSAGERLALVNSPPECGVVVDPRGRRDPVVLGRHPRIGRIAQSPDGNWVATATYRGAPGSTVQVWDARTGKAAGELATGQGSGDAFLAFSADSRWLVTAAGKRYSFWQTGTWQRLDAIRYDGPAFGSVAFSQDGTLLALSHARRTVQLLDAASRRELAQLTVSGSEQGYGFRFNRDGTQLVMHGDSQLIQVWDLRRLREELAALGLDWDLPPDQPADGPPAPDVK
jgi:WD40 repeat protein